MNPKRLDDLYMQLDYARAELERNPDHYEKQALEDEIDDLLDEIEEIKAAQ